MRDIAPQADVSDRGGLPVNDREHVVEVSNGIDIGDELVSLWKLARELDLQVLAWPRDPNPIILHEALDEVDAAFEH